MELIYPVIITPRLLPGVEIGDAFISIEYASPDRDRNGRNWYRYYIDIKGKKPYVGNDIGSGADGGDLQEGLGSVLAFLGAAGEAVNYERSTRRESENSKLFPKRIMEWAAQNSDELACLRCQLEEGEEDEEGQIQEKRYIHE